MWSHGSFYWNELMTRDPEAAMRFYGETIGWSFVTIRTPAGATYWIAKMGDRPVGGIFSMSWPSFEHMPEQWMTYLAVDDLDARLKKAEAAGATVIRVPFDVPGIGRIAILREPSGAAIGWMTPTNPGYQLPSYATSSP